MFEKVLYMLICDLTNQIGLHGNSYGSHGEEGEDRLIDALVLKQISREIDREEVTLGSHIGHMPEGHVCLTHDKLTSAEHDAIYTCRRRRQIQCFTVAEQHADSLRILWCCRDRKKKDKEVNI